MDKFEQATLATQEVILDLASEQNIGLDDLADKLGIELDEVSEWLEKPSLTYYMFLKCCSIVKKPAGEIFTLTKQKLTGKTSTESTTSSNAKKSSKVAPAVDNSNAGIVDDIENGDDVVLHDVEVDSKAAGLSASGDLMLRWSAVMEAMAQKTKQPIEKVRGLFDGAPIAVSDDEVYIALKNDNDKTRKMASKLLKEAIVKAGVIDADKLVISFDSM